MDNYTPRIKTLLALANKSARAHGDTYTGTEHLLHALISVDSPLSERAVKYLLRCGIDIKLCRAVNKDSALPPLESPPLKISDLKPGVMVRGKTSGIVYTITENLGQSAIGVKTQDISNPNEWEIVTP